MKMNQQFLEILLALVARDGHTTDALNSACFTKQVTADTRYATNTRLVEQAMELYETAKCICVEKGVVGP